MFSPWNPITGLIHNADGSGAEVSTVRAAQQTSWTLSPGAWFQTNDLSTFDDLHFDVAGVNTVGERFAQTYSGVPEPSTYALLALGSLLMVLLRCAVHGGRSGVESRTAAGVCASARPAVIE